MRFSDQAITNRGFSQLDTVYHNKYQDSSITLSCVICRLDSHVWLNLGGVKRTTMTPDATL